MISVEDFDFNTSTVVCKTMEHYGSDKGSARVGAAWHNYTIVYNKLFEARFQAPLRIFELGLGTTNPAIPCGMGAYGKPGASLYGWRDLFPNSSIFGADIDRDILFKTDRISTFYCDQTSPAIIQELWKNPELQEPFDIIIDDGLHTFDANKTFFEHSIQHLRKGGYYIIEDINNGYRESFKNAIKIWKQNLSHLSFSLLHVPLECNSCDNRLLVIHYPDVISPTKAAYLEMEKKAPKDNRNLVYFSVFFNRDYFKLADLLLKSIRFYSETDTIDFLILTTEDFQENVYELCAAAGVYVKIQLLPFKTIFQAACARLYIFDYKNINQYKTILYLDTDILIKGNLKTILGFPLEERVYGLECGTIHSPSFGVQFFGPSANPSIKGFNSGTLLFPNCLPVRDVFSRIRGHCDAYSDSKAAIPYCMDQPFINYHCIKGGVYNNVLLNPYVSLFEGYDEVKNEATSIVCHFSFPIGNSGHKLNRMKKYFAEMLEAKKEAVGGTVNPVGRRYSWGAGYIKFLEKGIETPWGNGEYASLGSNWFRVNWNGCFHVIRMNDAFTGYSGLRIWPNDFGVSHGGLQPF